MIEDERIATYIHSLDQELPEKIKIIEEEAIADGVPIIRKSTQTLLQFLFQMHKPVNILEVGCAVGFSSILMSEELAEGGHITTIEKMPERIEKAKENFKFAEKEQQITLLEGDATEILAKLVAENREYDMIFMDAAKGQYIHFFDNIMKLLKKDGLLVSDNVLQEGGIVQSRYAIIKRNRTIHSRMREYLYMLTHHEQLKTVILPFGDGVTLSTKLK